MSERGSPEPEEDDAMLGFASHFGVLKLVPVPWEFYPFRRTQDNLRRNFFDDSAYRALVHRGFLSNIDLEARVTDISQKDLHCLFSINGVPPGLVVVPQEDLRDALNIFLGEPEHSFVFMNSCPWGADTVIPLLPEHNHIDRSVS